MYKIGELSKLCKLPVKTLRYYDSEGLLIPDEIDKFTGYRYYSASRLVDCYRIIALKELGFTLEEIRTQLKAQSQSDILELIERKQLELQNFLLQTNLQLRKLDSIKQNIKTEGEKTMFNVVIRSSDSLSVVSRRNIYQNKADAYDEIEKIKKSLPKNIIGKRSVIINYETEYRESNFDLAVCVEITDNLPKSVQCVERKITLSSDVAMLVCKTWELDNAYRAMIKELEQTPCQIIGPFYEIYHDEDTVELKVPVCRLSIHNDRHKKDDINLPFYNDEDAIGKWKFVDVVPSEEQFFYGREKSNQGVWLDELYILPNGEPFWAVSGWTKGWLFTSGGYPEITYKNKYTIKTIKDKKIMFIEMKDYDHESRGGIPTVWIYEKVSDKIFKKEEIRIRDKTDIPFVLDNTVLGSWKVRDFVLEAEMFDVSKQNFSENGLFFKRVEFKDNGSSVALFGEKDPYKLFWTKGLLLDKHNETVEKYMIKVIDNKEYLFIEWKSGDYTFGGKKPYWYVFKSE
ncbi:MAG: transcription activator effector binding protein [Haloplasmataceae bacterium]|nr:transcription activator effector binding protein [Haloplasmataceae bacterium]